jgi:hypothetical protein
MRAAGAGVPAVSLRAEVQPADLRRPVPHPKPGAHSQLSLQKKTRRAAGRPPLIRASPRWEKFGLSHNQFVALDIETPGAARRVDGCASAGPFAEPKGRRRSSIAAGSRHRDPHHEARTASRPPKSDQNRYSARARWAARSRGTPNPELGCSARRASAKSDRPDHQHGRLESAGRSVFVRRQ